MDALEVFAYGQAYNNHLNNIGYSSNHFDGLDQATANLYHAMPPNIAMIYLGFGVLASVITYFVATYKTQYETEEKAILGLILSLTALCLGPIGFVITLTIGALRYKKYKQKQNDILKEEKLATLFITKPLK